MLLKAWEKVGQRWGVLMDVYNLVITLRLNQNNESEAELLQM